MSLIKNQIIVLLALLFSLASTVQILETYSYHPIINQDPRIRTEYIELQPLSKIRTPSSFCRTDFVESVDKVCIKPQYIEGCSVYKTTSTCHQCVDGYLLNKNNRCNFQPEYKGVINHLIGCLKQSDDTCEVCAQGFYKKQNNCLLGVKNCAQYNEDGQCIECQKDYSLILSKCKKNALLGCKHETDLHTCQQCYSPFLLNGQHCDIDQCRVLNDYGCVQCECGFYLTPERNCKPFAPGCLRYEKGICKDCLVHYKLKGGACQIEGCLQYFGNYCRKCSDKYDLIEGECHFKNCQQWLNDQCLACQSGFGVQNGSCIEMRTDNFR